MSIELAILTVLFQGEAACLTEDYPLKRLVDIACKDYVVEGPV